MTTESPDQRDKEPGQESQARFHDQQRLKAVWTIEYKEETEEWEADKEDTPTIKVTAPTKGE